MLPMNRCHQVPSITEMSIQWQLISPRTRQSLTCHVRRKFSSNSTGSRSNSISINQYAFAFQHWSIVLNMYEYVVIAMKAGHRLQIPNCVQLEGTTYHSPKLHQGVRSSIGMQCEQTKTAVANMHPASAMPHAECNKELYSAISYNSSGTGFDVRQLQMQSRSETLKTNLVLENQDARKNFRSSLLPKRNKTVRLRGKPKKTCYKMWHM